MNDNKDLDSASEFAFAELERVGGDPHKLDIPIQTVVVIFSAQGVIDNGGFQYFFESDFPQNPPYSFISDAYRRIGATEAAGYVDEAVAMFPFPDPHLSAKKRNAWMKKHAPEGSRFIEIGDRVCGDETVWKKLAKYVAANRKAFKGSPSR
jgi:hypothetical protein